MTKSVLDKAWAYLLRKMERLGVFEIAKGYRPFPSEPFGSKAGAEAMVYANLAGHCAEDKYGDVSNWEERCGYRIERIWLDKLALLTQVTIKQGELNYQHGRLLYAELSRYIYEQKEKGRHQDISVLEIGTAKGFSSICMARALIDSGTTGHIVSIDPIPHKKRIYWNCIKDNEGRRSREELLEDYKPELKRIVFIQGWSPYCLERIGLHEIGLAFIDGIHLYEQVKREYAFISRHQKAGDIIVFDDIQECEYSGVERLVSEIESKGEYAIKRLWSSDLRGYAVATKCDIKQDY